MKKMLLLLAFCALVGAKTLVVEMNYSNGTLACV